MEYGRVDRFATVKARLARYKASICMSILTLILLYSIFGKSHKVYYGSQKKFVYPKVFNDDKRDVFVPGIFPSNFKFGLATAAYQVEGGWQADGKGPSIWDTFAHQEGNIFGNQNGDDATKSYYKWDEDVKMLQKLGADFYRFSFSWSRILPTGFYRNKSDINQEGIDFYNHAIDSLISSGIEPMVTLYHWDLPQGLQNEGGLQNANLPRWFSDYARLCFSLFGDRVKHWITFNEPLVFASCFEDGKCAPGVSSPGVGVYEVIHQVLLAHQSAYHFYSKEFRAIQKGEVGLLISTVWTEPFDESSKNIAAAERANEFNMGYLLSPLLGTGDYPEIMKTTIAKISDQQFLKKSRLPEFTADEKKLLLGSVDFIGVNYYTAQLGRHIEQIVRRTPSFNDDMSVRQVIPPEWPKGASDWFHYAPFGIRHMLRWVHEKYAKGTKIYLLENGYSDFPEQTPCSNLDDIERVKYVVSHINQVYRAITEDNIRVERYTMWSLLDNFEWTDGYNVKFGVYCVDFEDPEKKRVARYSADVYSKIMKDRGFSDDVIAELESKHIFGLEPPDGG